jgi:hypothetical protein
MSMYAWVTSSPALIGLIARNDCLHGNGLHYRQLSCPDMYHAQVP